MRRICNAVTASKGIYKLLQEKAKTEHRSLAQEAVIALAKGLGTEASHKDRRKKLLQSIIANSANIPKETEYNPDPVSLIREDRDQ